MKWITTNKLFIIVIFLAACLRLYHLGDVPPSPDWDEAALGYNAYSLLKTGRDEYGVWLPRTLRSFDDYKPPLYAYLTIPTVAVFGLDVWSVRLPSAIMGILAVVGVYFLVMEILKVLQLDRNKKSPEIDSQSFATLTAFLLAISPWHIQFSRIAFEANIGLTLNIWGLYAVFKGLSSGRWLGASAFIFGLALYAYHSERIFIPLLVLIMGFLWFKQILPLKKYAIQALLIGFITVLPLIPVVFDKTSMVRLTGTSVLADQTGLLHRSVQKLQIDKESGNFYGTFFDNRRVVYMQKIFDGYVSHFSLRWLFLSGDNERHHAPDHGLLYLWELPFLFLGMYYVATIGGKLAWFLFLWFFIAPVAASPTTETPHAIRTLVFLPTFQIFIAFGLISFWKWIRLKIYQSKNVLEQYAFNGLLFTLVILMVGSVVYFLHMYFVHLNIEYSKFWQFGYKEAVAYATEHKQTVNKIVVSTKLEQPHMFFLFYTKYDPEMYFKRGGTKSGGFAETRNAFDNYEFRPINWSSEIHDGSVLYIGTPSEIQTDVEYTIYYLNGEEAIRIGR